MELGHTIPLQKYLRMQPPPYGAGCPLFFCWELHRIILQSGDTLVAVNAGNRFAVVLWGMDAGAWNHYQEHFREGLEMAMESEGYTREEIRIYLKRAGKFQITKTHGRRSVAGLNQMDNCLWKIPALVKKGQLFQPVHCHEVNRERCRMAGYEGCQYPVQCFGMDMEQMLSEQQDAQEPCHDTILQQS